MTRSPWASLVLTTLFSIQALGLGVPIQNLQGLGIQRDRRAGIEQKRAVPQAPEVDHQNEKRLVCIYDGVLNGMINDLDDAIPFCSSYLGIQDVTATNTVAARQSITTVFTTYDTVTDPTVTEYESTVTETAVSFADRQAFAKRQQAGITPFNQLAAACTLSPLNSSLISKVSSGCSCLRIKPATDYIPVTLTSTRTFSGIDYEQTTVRNTVTIPAVKTVTITVPPLSQSTGGRGETTTSGPYGNSTVSSISSPTSDVTIVQSPSVSPSTSPTGSLSLSQDTRTNSPIISSTSAGPSFPANTTSIPGTVSSGTGIAVTTSSTGSFSGSLTIPTDTRTGVSQSSGTPSSNVTTSQPSSVNNLPSTTSSTSPSSTAPVEGCPGRNGTTYTTQCQEFLILCYKNYNGPTNQGIIETSLNECIEDCAKTNRGFSADDCFGLTYNTSATTGPNCFFKKQAGLKGFVDDDLIVAAVLINNNTCTTSTPSIPTPSLSIPVSSRTGPGLPSTLTSALIGNSTIPIPTVTSYTTSSSIASNLGNTTIGSGTGTFPSLSIPSNTRTGPPVESSGSVNATTSSGTGSIPSLSIPSNTRTGPPPVSSGGTNATTSSGTGSVPSLSIPSNTRTGPPVSSGSVNATTSSGTGSIPSLSIPSNTRTGLPVSSGFTTSSNATTSAGTGSIPSLTIPSNTRTGASVSSGFPSYTPSCPANINFTITETETVTVSTVDIVTTTIHVTYSPITWKREH